MQVGASAAKSSILTNCARGCLCTLTMARGRRQEAGGGRQFVVVQADEWIR